MKIKESKLGKKMEKFSEDWEKYYTGLIEEHNKVTEEMNEIRGEKKEDYEQIANLVS